MRICECTRNTRGAAPKESSCIPAGAAAKTIMHRRAYWDGHGLFCEADYHERFPRAPLKRRGSFTCHKCWASQPVGKKYIERTSVNDLRVLRCQTCNNDDNHRGARSWPVGDIYINYGAV